MNSDDSEILHFKRVELKDTEILRNYLSKNENRLCDWTIGGTIMWRDYFNMEYTIWNNSLIIKLDYLRGIKGFSFLANGDVHDIIEVISKHCKKQEIPLIFCLADEDLKDKLLKSGGSLHIVEEIDWFDYLYRESDLAELSGKRYATQRNHINKFKNTYEYEVLSYNDSIKEEIKLFLISFFNEIEEDNRIKTEELKKSLEVFENIEIYKLDTLVIRIKGVVVGVIAGELVNDTLYIHIQKAIKGFSGIYAMLNYLFVNKFKDTATYVNLEEDVGDEGLRYTKEKYRPIGKVKKYTIEYLIRG